MGGDRIDSVSLFLATAEDTFEFGKKLASLLSPDSILALSGDLGAGKTTFTQGLASGLRVEEEVTSPTFCYLNTYEGTLPLFHFDLYRLKTSSDFQQLGFDEYFAKGGICAIEWPERISIPTRALSLTFTYEGTGRSVRLATEDRNLLYSLANIWV